MHHVYKPKLTFLGLLAIVFAAIIVSSAAASPVLQDVGGTSVASSTTKAPLVIPYLSHGVGIDQSQYSGTSSSSARTPLVIPYLSHGQGVDASLYSGQSHTADAEQSFNRIMRTQPSDVFTRAVERHYLLVHGMNVAGSTSAVRPDDRAGIRGITGSSAATQSQSTAVRPDDRAGVRGIGTTTAGQSTASTSSTDWSTFLMAGGAVLAAMLLVLAAVLLLNRRQHGRVLAH